MTPRPGPPVLPGALVFAGGILFWSIKHELPFSPMPLGGLEDSAVADS